MQPFGRPPEVEDGKTVCFFLGREHREYLHLIAERIQQELGVRPSQSVVMRRLITEHRDGTAGTAPVST